jgi:cell division protein FtsB
MKTMARNRKYKSAAIRFGPVLKTVVICAIIGGACVGYVWQKDQISRLGKQILERERRIKELQALNVKLQNHLGDLRSPQYLEAKIKDLKLGLVRPSPSQVWRLAEPMAEDPGWVPVERNFVAQGSRGNPSP